MSLFKTNVSLFCYLPLLALNKFGVPMGEGEPLEEAILADKFTSIPKQSLKRRQLA